MKWTDERVEQLKKLVNENLSASQIATALGGFEDSPDRGKNAVIGKTRRLGLHCAGNQTGCAKRPRAATQKQLEPAEDDRAAVLIGAAHGVKAMPMSTLPHIPVVQKREPVIPVAKRFSLTMLTEQTCKWPIGDPSNHENFHFCGHDSLEGSPYCEYHSAVAYQPTPVRRYQNSRPPRY